MKSKFLSIYKRIGIGTKLISLIAILLLVSVVILVTMSTRLFIDDNTALIQQMNADTANNLAAQTREYMKALSEKARLAGRAMVSNAPAAQREQLLENDKDIHSISLVGLDSRSKTLTLRSSLLVSANAETHFKRVVESSQFDVAALEKGEPQAASVSLDSRSQVVALLFPFVKTGDRFTQAVMILVKQARFTNAFTESEIVNAFLVDRNGIVLVHKDLPVVARKENFKELGVVEQLLSGKFNNGQTRYVHPKTGEALLGAFKLVGLAQLGVVAEVAEAKAFEGARRIRYRSALVAFVILCLAFFTGYHVSGSITWPIQELVQAAKKIASGDFKISLKPKSQDEVGHLALAFNDMAKGLEERDKVKETFQKFHSKEIAEKLLSGEVKLGGERMSGVVLFSDLRGFTALSEAASPEAVVDLLNEYMTEMVTQIQSNGGIVDKYIGDAIMALWGIPLSKDGDAENAIRGCLAMRLGLVKLNERRLGRGEQPLRIGIGLNAGPVIAGNIGSSTKMEYTVIGDTVNLASRVEGMTKEFGTDCLVTQSVHDLVKEKFVWEKCKPMKVKGKTEPIQVYKLLGYIDASGNPILVQTPYSSYGATRDEKTVHDDVA